MVRIGEPGEPGLTLEPRSLTTTNPYIGGFDGQGSPSKPHVGQVGGGDRRVSHTRRSAMMGTRETDRKREMVEKRELGKLDFVREFTDAFGPERSLQLVGFCVLYRLAGYPKPGDLRARGFFGLKKSAIYNAFTDLRRFREHLVVEGYERIGLTDPASNTYEQTIDLLGQVVRSNSAVDRGMVDAVVLSVQPTGQQAATAATV